MAEDQAAIERAAVAAITADAGGSDGTDAKMTDEGEVLEGELVEGEVGKDVDIEDDPDDVDAQIEAMKRQLEHVEAEAQRIQMGNGGVDGDSGGSGVLGGVPANNADNEMAITNGSANGASLPTALPAAGAPSSVPRTDLPVTDTEAAIAESDARSVYVGNVDYGATVEELGAHFADCGTINRVTIMTNKGTGMPKGFAYIEFADESSVKHATILDSTTFRQRKIKVVAKRTNVPGMSFRGTYGRRPRYRGGYGRGYGRRPRRGFRGRWSPY